MTYKEQTNNMSYIEYRSNELKIINKEFERKFNLVRGLDLPNSNLVIFQIMLATVVEDLYSREFLIYFLQNQKRLVEEQRKSMEEEGL